MVTGHIWCTSLIILSCLLFVLGHIGPGAHDCLDPLLRVHVYSDDLCLGYHIEQLVLNRVAAVVCFVTHHADDVISFELEVDFVDPGRYDYLLF